MSLVSLSIVPTTKLRVARPSRDLAAAERFYVAGLGLSVLHRNLNADEYASILIVGLPQAPWHLELALANGHAVLPTPTPEDLLVLYLGAAFSGEQAEAMVAHLEAHGGQRVPALNPYWNTWGVTVQDPDGYRGVLCSRGWTA